MKKIKSAFKHNGRNYYIDSFDIRSATIKTSDISKEVIGKKYSDSYQTKII